MGRPFKNNVRGRLTKTWFAQDNLAKVQALLNIATFGFTILGRAISNASGQNFRDFIEDRLLMPRYVQRSAATLDSARLATGYAYEENTGWVAQPVQQPGAFGALNLDCILQWLILQSGLQAFWTHGRLLAKTFLKKFTTLCREPLDKRCRSCILRCL